MNKVALLGRLTHDPEIRYTQSAQPLAYTSFRMAINRRYKREGEPAADFINCKAFGKPAELICTYFKKGRMICVSGRIQTDSHKNKDGNTVYTTEVIVEEMSFPEGKASAKNSSAPRPSATGQDFGAFQPITNGAVDDDSPFQQFIPAKPMAAKRRI